MLYMKKLAPFFFIAFCVSFAAIDAVDAAVSDDRVWREIDDSALRGRDLERQIVPDVYKTFRLSRMALTTILKQAPEEFTDEARSGEVILTLPMPDGTFSRFRIEHSLVVEPGLLEKYPELGATYRGYGIDDPTASVRFDLLPMGFHAMIRSSSGSVFLDPYAKGDIENYISYFKKDLRKTGNFDCQVGSKTGFESIFSPEVAETDDFVTGGPAPEVTSGSQLRTYRLALASTNEYTDTVGGNTIAGALAAEVLIMNRVNGVYERDVAIHMNIVANNNLVTYADDNSTCGAGNNEVCTPTNDPYSNSSGSTMLGQNQTRLDAVIGTANYDIGHVFSTGGGGVATLSGPCGGNKARGVTGLLTPLGDPFAIDYVAHEMGHQWSGSHTFNGASGSCAGGNRSAANAFEVGSGITIMAYAGICDNQDLAGNSIDTFHVRSLEQIVAFSQTGNGNTCAATAASGNTPPTVAVVGGPSFIIPKQTPFTLTASASDVNGDTITYDWQEYDLGASTTAVPNTDSDGNARPIFRTYLPISSPSRTYPSLEYILNNANVPPATTGGFLTGELLPAITRTMIFQIVARDNRANAGGINTATATVNVDGNSGPLAVTAPNTGVVLPGNSSQTVTWNVANTTAAPVSSANVKISLSTDGGQTFPTTIIASTPNDGSQAVTVPNVATTTARIKIEAVGNIFFDISDANFTISASAAVRRPFDFDGDGKTDISIYRPAVGQWWYQRSGDGQVFAAEFGISTDKIAPADFTGDGKTDLAFFRPGTGAWFVLRSENFTFYGFPFGTNGDTPVPADYDGDSKADAAVYRPSNNAWFILRSSDSGVTSQIFGIAGDKPVTADYDGDGKSDIAIWRPGPSEWWIQRSTAGLYAAQFGLSTDRTVPGDYTGDGKADIAFWRPSTGTWFVIRSEDSSFFGFPFGSNGDTPAPGDYDGDGKFDAAVFRPSNSTWFVNRSTAGVLIQTFGVATDTPVPSVFVN